MQDAVQLHHNTGAGEQFLKLHQFRQGQHVATFAATRGNDFNIEGFVGIERHGIEVDAVDQFFQGKKAGYFVFGHVSTEIHGKTAFPVALINASVFSPENLFKMFCYLHLNPQFETKIGLFRIISNKIFELFGMDAKWVEYNPIFEFFNKVTDLSQMILRGATGYYRARAIVPAVGGHAETRSINYFLGP